MNGQNRSCGFSKCWKDEINTLKLEINRLRESMKAPVERATEKHLLEVQSSGENMRLSDIKRRENERSVEKDGIQHYNLIDHIAGRESGQHLNSVNRNVLVQHAEDVQKGNTRDKEINAENVEKTEGQDKNQETYDVNNGSTDLDPHQPSEDPMRMQEIGIESNNFCFNNTREEAEEYSSDEVLNDNIVQLPSMEDVVVSSNDEHFKMLSFARKMKALQTEDDKEEEIKIENVVQYIDGAENPPTKNIKGWINKGSITNGTGRSITLPKKLRNLMISLRYGEGKRDQYHWVLNWSNNSWPQRDYNVIVFAMPYNVVSRIVPLQPRSFVPQNNTMYQYECIRIASFSTYRGCGFRVVFAQAGFVFDPATNMVVCPWCNVYVYNNVNIINMHFPDCMMLQINIPFRIAPSALVPAANRQAFRQVGGLSLASAPVQTPNTRSVMTPALPIIDVMSQEHARRGPLEAIGRTNQRHSYQHATLSAHRSSEAGESSAYSIHSCIRRNFASTTHVTGLLHQCNQSAEQNASMPFLRVHCSTDLAQVVFHNSSTGNGNTQESSRRVREENGSEVSVDNKNKEIEEGAVGVVSTSATCFCQEDIEKCLRTDAAQAVLDMGYKPDVVLRAIERVLLKRGCHTLTGKSIMEAVLDMEGDDDRATSEHPPCSLYSNTRNQGDTAVERTPTHGTISDPRIKFKMIAACKVCQDNKVSLSFLPCCQFVICEDCSAMYRKCPICKTLI